MNNQISHADDEIGDFEMLPSQAAAVRDFIITWTNANRAGAKSLADLAVLRMLDVQSQCIGEANVMWTSAADPAVLAAKDALGTIKVRLAMPQSVLWAYVAASAEEHFHPSKLTPAHLDVLAEIKTFDQIGHGRGPWGF